MTLNEAIALQPQWIQIWLNVLFLGAFVLPLTLLIWKATRKAALLTLLGSILAAIGIFWMYDLMGYVRLLGLPHILFWTPVVIYLYGQQKRLDLIAVQRWIMRVIILIMVISLTFDIVDSLRWLLGERGSMI